MAKDCCTVKSFDSNYIMKAHTQQRKDELEWEQKHWDPPLLPHTTDIFTVLCCDWV